ncbi:MAG: alpha/beta hydrolase [Candidatus Marinimicrobia bacterium]|nr:alpha/beta hydrolase [Candidatus Neomarinimicrobiota bacterium]MBL7010422.1 alpha/beta hydrolase [Candidatus Neomarinimicrobiota bacterium]MBL7030726.1 alpha/beta hydrolase [Candidatus Neomarinimicrobiota bacterium]
MIRLLKYLIIGQILLAGCEQKTTSTISYFDLNMDNVKVTGKMIQEKSMGLHWVQTDQARADTIFIAVHGYGSEGYEWVYALRKMAESGHKTYYYRWDWSQCPEPASRMLISVIDSLVSAEVGLNHINIFGHSYGGVIVTGLADDHLNVSLDIHSIAAPLAGHTRLEKNCPDYPRFNDLKLTSKLVQWRTVHKQDGAFKNLAANPQLIEIKGSEVVQLPAVFPDGRRLGHNWSITWVMDQYFSGGR